MCLRPTCEEDRCLNYWLGRHREDLSEEVRYYFHPVVKPEGVKGAVWPLTSGEEEDSNPVVESVPVREPLEESLTEVEEQFNPESESVVGEEKGTEVVRKVQGKNKPPIAPSRRRMQEKGESSVVVGDVLEAGEESLGLVEGSGESCDGSAVKEGGQGAIVEPVEADMGDLAWSLSQFEGIKHREELARLTCLDESLEVARKFADEGKGGYSWSEGLLLKHRLDDLGRNAKQLCLPKENRQKCMSLAHEKLGHRGKQKCAEVIENAERVQALREQATVNYSDVSIEEKSLGQEG